MLSGAQGGAFIGLYGGVFAFWQKHTSAPPEYARITLLCLMLCSVPSKILYSIRTETQNFFSRMQKDRNRGMKYSRGCRGAGGVGVLEVASQSMTFVAGGVLEASGF